MFKTFAGETLFLETMYYASGAMAVIAQTADGEPYATLSVNLPQSEALPEDHFYLKAYSENGVVAYEAIEAGVIEAADPFIYAPVKTGFITLPVYFVK